MTLDITIENDLKQLRRQLDAFERKAAPQATVRTLNRVAESARVASTKHISPQLGSKQAGVKRRIETRKATLQRLWVTLVAHELGELEELGFDLDLTGFEAVELEKLLDGATMDGLTDDDAIPEAPEIAVTKEGDIWLLGDHKLICGDSCLPKTMKALMGGELADMIFTDPPYNVDYGQSMKDKVRGNKRKIKNDNLGDGFQQFLNDACNNMVKVCKGAMYICMSSSELHTLQKAFADAGGHWSTFIIWAKNTFTMGRADYQRQYEPILYGWPEGNKHFWCGDRSQSDVWALLSNHRFIEQ